MTTYSIDLHDIQLSLSDFQIMYVAWKRTTFLLRLLPVVATSGSLVQAIDLVLGNAKVYTVDSPRWAEAVAIDEGGSIVAVGPEPSVLSRYSTASEYDYVDMEQRLIIPGFQDAHVHAVEAGINAKICYVYEYSWIEDIPHAFRARHCPRGGTFGDQGWVVGVGIDLSHIFELLEDPWQDYPIDVLDDAFPNTPVLILDSLGHGALVNTEALTRVGYDRLRGNPPGGIIHRDEFNGLTGVVLENAQQPFRDKAFPPTGDNQQIAFESLLDALTEFAANGITSVSDAGGFWRQAQIEAWAQAEDDGVLTVRASNALYIYPDIPIEEQLPELVKRFSNDRRKLVRFNQAKIYADGILSLGTAALYEPYEPDMKLQSQERKVGFEYFPNDSTGISSLNEVAARLSFQGFQLHFHVAGDRAAGLALDAIAGSDVLSGPHRLTHLYLVDEKDRGRFVSSNIVADFQLAPSSLSPSYLREMNGAIGTTRASELLPATALFDEGAFLTISSDWDADTLSPLVKLQAVLTRGSGRPIPDIETAVEMMTINPAKLLQQDDQTGSISVGKFADLAIIDKDIFQLLAHQIKTARVVATLFQGDPVYDPQGIFGSPIEKGKSFTSSSSSPRLRPTGTALGFMLSTILYMYIYVVSVEK